MHFPPCIPPAWLKSRFVHTHIKIISEEEAKMNKPDYFLVLPWHFKDNILGREKEYLKTGVKFIFPLPEIEII